jgi:hypothetical protein
MNRRLLAMVEELKVPPTPEIFWPIAGKKLFPSGGELPRRAIKHMSRNAGAIVAPFMTYSASLEVGQTALYHSWRKRVLQCESFDELALHIRILQNNMDMPVRIGSSLLLIKKSSLHILCLLTVFTASLFANVRQSRKDC